MLKNKNFEISEVIEKERIWQSKRGPKVIKTNMSKIKNHKRELLKPDLKKKRRWGLAYRLEHYRPKGKNRKKPGIEK